MPRLTRVISQYQKAKELYLKYERILMPGTLVVGFIVDYITFTSIEIRTALTVLLIYWLAAGSIILFINLYDEGKIGERLRYGRLAAPLFLQFFFGALLGGSFIFYWFSGTFSVSWPFILLLVILMVSNDFLREHFHKPLLQVNIYFFITLSLSTVMLPFIFNSLSAWLFILAGVVSTGIIYGFIQLLQRIRNTVGEKHKSIWAGVISILIIMNLFYFTSIIPPIPLSIREAGIYHSIEKSNATYTLVGEKENIFQKIIPGQTLHIQPKQRVYAYSSIFAPTNLNTTIYHTWYHYNPDTKQWLKQDRFAFPIFGGRNDGYRGFTWKSNLQEGKWKINVETQRGRTLGQISFAIKHTQEDVLLIETKR
ncbi:MAG: DUF2914 domain-containing protein [Candidatus Paceibacterota bacterium]